MEDLFWNLFKNSGSVDAFMTYKAYDNYNKSKENSNDYAFDKNSKSNF